MLLLKDLGLFRNYVRRAIRTIAREVITMVIWVAIVQLESLNKIMRERISAQQPESIINIFIT